MRPMPIEMYRRGLADWARGNVDVGAFRTWQAEDDAGVISDKAATEALDAAGGVATQRVAQWSNIANGNPVMQWGTWR
jgi:hypothetical protein